MSYRCGYCKGRHARLETVQQCARDMYVTKGNEAPENEPVQAGPARSGVTRVPPGWYSFRQGREAHVVAQVRVPQTGRWKGRYFVNMWSDGECKPLFDRTTRMMVIQNLLTSDYGVYMMLFGRQTGLCPVCEGELIDVERGDGIHVLEKKCYMVATGAAYRLEEIQNGGS